MRWTSLNLTTYFLTANSFPATNHLSSLNVDGIDRENALMWNDARQ